MLISALAQVKPFDSLSLPLSVDISRYCSAQIHHLNLESSNLPPSPPHTPSHLSLSLSVSVCLSVSLSVSLCLSLCLPPPCRYEHLLRSNHLNLSLFLSLSKINIYPPPPLCVWVSALHNKPCVSVSLSLFLSPPPPLSHDYSNCAISFRHDDSFVPEPTDWADRWHDVSCDLESARHEFLRDTRQELWILFFFLLRAASQFTGSIRKKTNLF